MLHMCAPVYTRWWSLRVHAFLQSICICTHIHTYSYMYKCCPWFYVCLHVDLGVGGWQRLARAACANSRLPRAERGESRQDRLCSHGSPSSACLCVYTGVHTLPMTRHFMACLWLSMYLAVGCQLCLCLCIATPSLRTRDDHLISGY